MTKVPVGQLDDDVAGIVIGWIDHGRVVEVFIDCADDGGVVVVFVDDHIGVADESNVVDSVVGSDDVDGNVVGDVRGTGQREARNAGEKPAQKGELRRVEHLAVER